MIVARRQKQITLAGKRLPVVLKYAAILGASLLAGGLIESGLEASSMRPQVSRDASPTAAAPTNGNGWVTPVTDALR